MKQFYIEAQKLEHQREQGFTIKDKAEEVILKIESISRNGKLEIGFNQPLLIP